METVTETDTDEGIRNDGKQALAIIHSPRATACFKEKVDTDSVANVAVVVYCVRCSHVSSPKCRG